VITAGSEVMALKQNTNVYNLYLGSHKALQWKNYGNATYI